MWFCSEQPMLAFTLFSLYLAASRFLAYHTVACVASDIAAGKSNASGQYTASPDVGTRCCLLCMG